MTTQEVKIEFDLLSNATDSINRAIELLAWTQDEPNEARRLKQAVLAIAHGVELLLKERLRRVHPVLIRENVDRYPQLNARTVTVDVAVNRLIKIGGLTFADSEVQLIQSLRYTRNAIEHYRWSTTKKEADRIVGHALGFAVDFAKAELRYEFFGYWTRKDDTFQSLLNAHPVFARAYGDRYEQRAKKDAKVNQLCEYCHTLAVNPSTGACEVCGHWNSDSDDLIPF